MSCYMIFRSDQNSEYYPDNTPYSFKVKLPQTMTLNGDWKVALTEITLTEDIEKEDILYIYTNICSESFINGENVPLLRRVISATKGNITFTPSYYIPVIKSEINEIEFTLENHQGYAANHIRNPISLVVHFAST